MSYHKHFYSPDFPRSRTLKGRERTLIILETVNIRILIALVGASYVLGIIDMAHVFIYNYPWVMKCKTRIILGATDSSCIEEFILTQLNLSDSRLGTQGLICWIVNFKQQMISQLNNSAILNIRSYYIILLRILTIPQNQDIHIPKDII